MSEKITNQNTDTAVAEGGNYELIRGRLEKYAKELRSKTRTLNESRKEIFGGQELSVIAASRIRTENACVARDMLMVKNNLLFTYNVFTGLRETVFSDVFTVQVAEKVDDGWNFHQANKEAFCYLDNEAFQKDFSDLYKYYKKTKLQRLMRTETHLLAVFQISETVSDIKVFRWRFTADGRVEYVDNRGDRDYVYPPQYDFKWIKTTREDHRHGKEPHVSIEDVVFVETVGGDLTVKIEDNTEDGYGIYREPVDDLLQTLDDGQIEYARLGTLVLLKLLPYGEKQWRHLIFNSRNHHVIRVDAIDRACVQLPSEHGVVFPGGYYLQTGEYKIFEDAAKNLEFEKMIRSPNGEDVLFVFHDRPTGSYQLLPYNLIRKEMQTPINCHGYAIYDDGRLVVNPSKEEATRIHAVQMWQTPFVSAEVAAAVPTNGSYLAKVGNAELVNGISEAFSIARIIEKQVASRFVYEDLISSCRKIIDAHYWIAHPDTENLKETLLQISHTAELIVDEFEKVQEMRTQAKETLEKAQKRQSEVVRKLRPEDLSGIDSYMQALSNMRTHRGQLITYKETRYISVEALNEMEQATIDEFDRVSQMTVTFLSDDAAFTPLATRINELSSSVKIIEKTHELANIQNEIDEVNEGINVLSEVISGLQVEDPTVRTDILMRISSVFAQLNQVRALAKNKRKTLLSVEGKAAFAAQMTLFNQSVSSSIAMADTPERCDDELTRLLLQLEELEARFSEFDEFLLDLATKREEVNDAVGGKKQILLDERQRKTRNLLRAGERILKGINRRAKTFKTPDELNSFYASDSMVLKLREVSERLVTLADAVKGDELLSRLKSAKQDALRGLRDRKDLFAGGDNLIKFGRHHFPVNTQPLELTMLPTDEKMFVHLTGTDFHDPVQVEGFNKTHEFWDQILISETASVYRAEYLAASILFDAENGKNGLSLELLTDLDAKGLLAELVTKIAANRFDEGYDRGLHDHDATKILEQLIHMRNNAGLLRFPPNARALAALFWAFFDNRQERTKLERRGKSLGSLRKTFAFNDIEGTYVSNLVEFLMKFCEKHGISTTKTELLLAARFLAEEMMFGKITFSTSKEASGLIDALLRQANMHAGSNSLTNDLKALTSYLSDAVELAEAWIKGFFTHEFPEQILGNGIMREAASILVCGTNINRRLSSAKTKAKIQNLLGTHKRIKEGALTIRLDSFLNRLLAFTNERVPAYREYRKLRQEVLKKERYRLRIDEFMPHIMSAFVRNRLINEVYLPLIGDNLAKQMGSAGENKRTDQMGLLLLISPPGYGKTTLMEYIANRLGVVFMKINGPSLGHEVISLDPEEAPNATARQEVEKLNLAFEMGNNVMLYLDDIQHTNPEFLQKFISLCDAQRKIEGVWRGRTQTYDMRGKKFSVVMAGNPYTESGDKFQIPDMLANRADVYNLGDILGGKEHVFALSYVENALTSNPVIAPLASRDLNDLYLLIKRANGEEIATNELSYAYSGVEITEITSVLKKMGQVRDVLLSVNANYVSSASQAEEYRTEPPFKLQGSYRNMAKISEKIVSAMTDKEVETLIEDHYVGESQTLTSGAEQNLLKLAELRGRLNEKTRARWKMIKSEFARRKIMGGGDDDPITRITGTLAALAQKITDIKEAVLNANKKTDQYNTEHLHLTREANKVAANHSTAQITIAREANAAVVKRDAAKRAATRQEAAAKEAREARKERQERKEKSEARKHQPARDPEMVAILTKLDDALEKLSSPKVHLRMTMPKDGETEKILGQQLAIFERTLKPLVDNAQNSLNDSRAMNTELIRMIRELNRILSDSKTPRRSPIPPTQRRTPKIR